MNKYVTAQVNLFSNTSIYSFNQVVFQMYFSTKINLKWTTHCSVCIIEYEDPKLNKP